MFVKGRTIKADGTEVPLKSDSVYERDLDSGWAAPRLKGESFAMPVSSPAQSSSTAGRK